MTMTLDTRPELALLDAACLCAERGLHVIPVWRTVAGVCPCPKGPTCISPGKHPAIDSWQTAATTDFTVLRDWFAPDTHNIGVVCGPSNIVVIDVDPRNGGDATLAVLIAELGPLPETVAADSGGGGAHYVFRRPSGELVSKLGDGVDLLRDSRQFLVEPSKHASGGMYRWRRGHAPDEIQIALLPDVWIKRIRRQAAKRPSAMPPIVTTDARIERARKYLARIPGAVAGQGGHTQTFNAVAAVMIGFDLDPDTTLSVIASDYNPRCSPPWGERDLLHKIRSVAERCTRERGYLLDANRRPVTTTQQAAEAVPPAEPDVDWSAELQTNSKGQPRRGYKNTLTVVEHHPDYRGRWSLNTMTGDVWFDGAPMRESLVHDIRAFIDARLGFTPPAGDVAAAIASAAEQRPFHPVREYLDSIDWDGTPRLAMVAAEYLGADGQLEAEMIRRWMIGAVARAMQPGCKFDTALMLYGPQGYFKSTFFSILGGQWHSDSTIDINNKDSYQQIHAAWIYEFSELENVVHGKAESRLKAFVASQYDLFRAPYKHGVERKARSMAFCGTTNRQDILTDETGSRRSWIVTVAHPIDREQLAHARDQLWAEARAAYEAGEQWWFDRDLEQQREAANANFEQDDPWDEPCRAWLSAPSVTEITVADVLTVALRMDVARQGRIEQMRVARVLKRLGWVRQQVRASGARRWIYVRP